MINNSQYLYSINIKYNLKEDTNILTLKVYLFKNKNTPLVIEFFSKNDYYIGSVLNCGIELENGNTKKIEIVNLNMPKYISQIILLGIERGWNGNNNIGLQDGIQYLKNLGYNLKNIYFIK